MLSFKHEFCSTCFTFHVFPCLCTLFPELACTHLDFRLHTHINDHCFKSNVNSKKSKKKKLTLKLEDNLDFIYRANTNIIERKLKKKRLPSSRMSSITKDTSNYHEYVQVSYIRLIIMVILRNSILLLLCILQFKG